MRFQELLGLVAEALHVMHGTELGKFDLPLLANQIGKVRVNVLALCFFDELDQTPQPLPHVL